VLKQDSSEDLRVYTVWVTFYPGDSERTVTSATKRISDKRVQHFWDGKADLSEKYRRVLGIDQPAWDVYFVYGRDAEWKSELPPAPAYWMHQLGGLPRERYLDGDRLAAEINDLLK
jgi:hypothetical protein